jgi:hemolysin activation/secretion protein
VDGYLASVKPGDIVKAEQLDRALMLLNDTPGVGGSRATLQPGASVGTTDLVVGLMSAAPYSGNVSVDNYGNRYTGETRTGGTLNFNSPLGLGDQVTLTALASNQQLTYGRWAYHRPLGYDGLRAGIAYAETRYRLGKEFATLNAHGSASGTSAFLVYPFVRNASTNLFGTLTRERKSLSDTVEATATVVDKGIEVTNYGLSGNRQDLLGGGGLTTMELTTAVGRLNINSAVARAIDAVSAQTRGGYTRIYYNVGRLQRVTENALVSVAFSGQRANKNLDSSEKFGLGGAYGVRAYPQGEGIGDSGYLTNLEWRYAFTGDAQGLLFYDTGMVVVNRYPFGTAANTQFLSGAGIGLNARIGGLQLRSSLAWRTGGVRPVSVPPSASTMPLLAVQATLPF